MPPALEDMAVGAAATDASVLILGEPGVGKDTLARRIHDLSARARKPFVAVGLACDADELTSAAIFGDASARSPGSSGGVLHAATGGTVYLGDVGEASIRLQRELLLARDEGRLGKVRLMADTNRDVGAEVKRGRLLVELLEMLSGHIFRIPPLRDRPAEIVPFARAFAAELASEAKRPIPTISAGAAAALERASWAGNVRQLRMVIELAMHLCRDGAIDVEHLPP
jgi:DNA-binding NtrC family response regulator